MQTFVAFPASTELDNNTQAFIQAMSRNPQRPDAAALTSIMTRFTTETLHAFFLVPAQQLHLQGAMMTIIKTTVSSISAASSLLVKRTAPKLNLAQNQAMADYMDILRVSQPDDQGQPVWHIAFPLKDALKEQVNKGLQQLDSGEIEQARTTLTDYLLGLTDDALHWYFEQPLTLLDLGPILSRLANASRHTARKGAHVTIQKVFNKLDAASLIAMGDYIRTLLVQADRRRPEQKPH